MTQDYNISFPQGTNQFGGSQTPSMKKTRSRFLGCFTIVIIIVIIFAGYFFVYPALTPNSIRGTALDFTLVPQKNGSSRLWVLTDGTFYKYNSSRGRNAPVTQHAFFCKTWMYVIDISNQSVLKKIKTEYDNTPSETATNLVYCNNKVYQISNGKPNVADKYEPVIIIANSETGDIIMDTKDFIGKYKELSSGLANLVYYKDENTIEFDTKDGGKGIIYSIANEKVYHNQSEYKKELEKDTTIGTMMVLQYEDGVEARRTLYLVKGPVGSLNINKSESTPARLMEKGATMQMLSEKVFLNGFIYHQDKECAIIIHVDQIGTKADRMMTCIDNTGREKWTIPQSKLFKTMSVDEDKDYRMFSWSSTIIGVMRAENLVILTFKREGIMAFDYETGKKLWEIDI